MEHIIGSFLKASWPVIVVAGGGLIAWGNLSSDVHTLKTTQEVMSNDHERIVRMDERQQQLSRDVAEMKQDIKDIAAAVK